MAKAEAVFRQASGAHGEANLLFTGDKRFVYTASGKSFVMYRPLAGLSFARYAPALSKIGATIYDIGEEVYGFRGLRAYKAKFGPTWRPVFIAAPGHVSLPMALASAALLTSGEWLGLLRS